MSDDELLSVSGWDWTSPPGVIPTHSDEALWTWTPTRTNRDAPDRFAAEVEEAGAATFVVGQLAADLGVRPGKLRSALGRLNRGRVARVDGLDVAIRLDLPLPVARPKSEKPTIGPLTISVPEAAEILGISRGAAYKAVQDGEIPSVTIGRRILIPTAKLHAILDGKPDG